MGKRVATSLIAILVVLIVAGCLGQEPTDTLEPGTEGPSHELRRDTYNESGSTEISAWEHNPVIHASTNVQGFSVTRPEHLHEAYFELEWSSAMSDLNDEARITFRHGFTDLADETGSGTLNLTVDTEIWDDEEANIRIHPYRTADPQVAVQLESQWNVKVTLVEQVPLTGEDPDERPRGSSRPQ